MKNKRFLSLLCLPFLLSSCGGTSNFNNKTLHYAKSFSEMEEVKDYDTCSKAGLNTYEEFKAKKEEVTSTYGELTLMNEITIDNSTFDKNVVMLIGLYNSRDGSICNFIGTSVIETKEEKDYFVFNFEYQSEGSNPGDNEGTVLDIYYIPVEKTALDSSYIIKVQIEFLDGTSYLY